MLQTNLLIKQAQKIVTNAVECRTDFEKDRFKGRGIVICAGGYKYFTNAWVLIKMLRTLGCNLPIQLWHFGEREIDAKMRGLVRSMEVQCVDAAEIPIKTVCRGWTLKAVAIVNCSFEEVLLLDADNLPLRDPSFLFDIPQYRKTGAVFWPDTQNTLRNSPIWKIFGIQFVDEPAVESGQVLINKKLCWNSLLLAEKLNLHGDLFFRFVSRGKDLFRLAWRKLEQEFAMPEFPPQILSIPDLRGEALDAAVCQHDFSGERLFQHRMHYKWNLLGQNPRVSGFFFENECREFLNELRKRWDGRCGDRIEKFDFQAGMPGKRLLVAGDWFLEFADALELKANAVKAFEKSCFVEDPLKDFITPNRNVGPVNFKAHADRRDPNKQFYHTKRTGPVLINLKFGSNGTITKGGREELGYYWDIKMRAGENQLVLSREGGEVLRFRQINSNYWEGYWVEAVSNKNAKLRTIQNIYPHLNISEKKAVTRDQRNKILQAVGRTIHVKCSSLDMGDHLSATEACAALSRLGVSVTFHTPFFKWLSRVCEPGLNVIKGGSESCRDIIIDPQNQMRYASSIASWYAAALHPLLKPVKLKMNLTGAIPRMPFKNYIVFTPSYLPLNASWRLRAWPDAHWTRLANLLRDEGYEIVVIGAADEASALMKIFGQTQAYWVVGQSPEWVIDALLGAVAYVGVDNPITRLAAMLQVKSIAVHAQFKASYLWPFYDVESVTPNTDCTGCRLQEDRGYFHSCNLSCSALATVGPKIVLRRLLRLLQSKR